MWRDWCQWIDLDYPTQKLTVFITLKSKTDLRDNFVVILRVRDNFNTDREIVPYFKFHQSIPNEGLQNLSESEALPCFQRHPKGNCTAEEITGLRNRSQKKNGQTNGISSYPFPKVLHRTNDWDTNLGIVRGFPQILHQTSIVVPVAAVLRVQGLLHGKVDNFSRRVLNRLHLRVDDPGVLTLAVDVVNLGDVRFFLLKQGRNARQVYDMAKKKKKLITNQEVWTGI